MRSGNAIASFARREPKLQKILQQIQDLTTQILRERATKRANFRHRTRLRRSREQCLHFNVLQRRRLDLWCVVHHRRRKFATSSRTFARKICTISAESALHANFCVAKRCADSSENTAPPPARIWQTSSVLCSARSRNSRKFCSWIFELSVPCEAMCAHFLPLEVYSFFQTKNQNNTSRFSKIPLRNEGKIAEK